MGDEDGTQATPETAATPDTTSTETTTNNAEESKDTGVLSSSLNEGEKPADGQRAEGEQEKASDGADDGVLAYEPFTLPDGMEISPEDQTAFTDIAQSLKLDQAGAQALIDLEARREQGRLAAEDSDTGEMHSGWQEALRNHETLGGDQFDTTMANLDMLGNAISEEGMEILADTKMFMHPHLVEFFHMVGKSLQENPAALGNLGGSSDPRSRAQKMFANSGHQ